VTLGEERYAVARLCECSNPCPDCKGDRRQITRGADGRTTVVPCACVALHRRIGRFNEAHIPSYFHSKSVEKYAAKSSEEQAVKRWMLAFQSGGQAGDRGVLLIGNPGVGKTHLMCGLLRYLTLERTITCRYVDSFQLLQDLKMVFEQGGASAQLLEEVCKVPILALDELGKTRPEGWQREVLDTIISRRYDAGLTTLVASNYPLPKEGPAFTDAAMTDLLQRETLDRRVGPRVFSRLMERCRTFVLQGEDRRLTQAQ
jgi:DNA replication protein DnaC